MTDSGTGTTSNDRAAAELKGPSVAHPKPFEIPLLWLFGFLAVLQPTLVTAPISGIPASATRFPFVAGLIDGSAGTSYLPFCTGTILTAQWVLTTAGCLKRPGRSKRRDKVKPDELILIFGTGFSPKATFSGAWTIAAGRYQTRKATDFVFPTEEDLRDVYEKDPKLDEIINSNNEYITKDKSGKDYIRYYLDFAAIKLDKALQWSEQVLPGIFPFQGKRLTRVWWDKKVQDFRNGLEFMEPCYMVGWGGWGANAENQMRLRYTQVRYVPYQHCDLSYCNECSYCNQTWRVKQKHQACYKSLLYADGCQEDEGAPVWCPWAGITTTRKGEQYETGAILGIVSFAASCYGKSVPSIYSNSWQGFPLISRAVGYEYPPSILVFEDILEDPPEARTLRSSKELQEQIGKDLPDE